MFIFDVSVFFVLVWIVGEDSFSLIVLMGIFCFEYVFVIGYLDLCSWRKFGFICYVLFMLILFGLFFFVNKLVMLNLFVV